MSLRYDLTQAAMGNKQYTSDTARVIRTGCKHFSEFCRDEGLNKMDKIIAADPREVIQRYADHLVSKNYSPASVHVYLYPACKALSVNMKEIRKPKRTSTTITRSRDAHANKQGKMEEGKPEYERLVEFQKRVGIRRSELAALKGKNLVRDESGYLCVEIEHGKGNRYQCQRIHPNDEKYIKEFFSKIDPDDYVFNSTELRNKIDLHAFRSSHARLMYDYYAGMSDEEKKVLIHELCTRWLTSHPECDTKSKEFQKWYSQLTKGGGVYKLRGDNYDRAVRNGRPVIFDRTAALACSVFALAHWRISVTITNYLI